MAGLARILVLALGLVLFLPGCGSLSRRADRQEPATGQEVVQAEQPRPSEDRPPQETASSVLSTAADSLIPGGTPPGAAQPASLTEEAWSVTRPIEMAVANSVPEACTPATSADRHVHALVRALEAFLEDRPEEAIRHLEAYEASDQELLLRLLPIVARVAKGGLLTPQLDGEERLTVLQTIRSLVRELEPSAPLVIEKLTFCRRVEKYGLPLPVASNQFRPGDQVGIYAELLNLTDRRLDDDRYAVRLSSTLEIRNSECRVVWGPHRVLSTPDWSRSPRTDHYALIRFQVPDLPPGVYTLQLSVADEDTGRAARRYLSFRVSPMAAPTADARSRPRP